MEVHRKSNKSEILNIHLISIILNPNAFARKELRNTWVLRTSRKAYISWLLLNLKQNKNLYERRNSLDNA